jgi:hypothetical protein
MLKEMCWMPARGREDTKILHLRREIGDAWQPYTALPQYAVPDYLVPGGSKGWATFQKLHQAGWKLVPSSPFFATDDDCKTCGDLCYISEATRLSERFPDWAFDRLALF